METFDTLWEQCRGWTQRRTDCHADWCDVRESWPQLQDVPFFEYLDRMRFLRQNLNRAASRDKEWPMDIWEFDCYLQGHRQGWRCAITGEPLSFQRGGREFNGQTANPSSCSIDRIDPHQGYVSGNIQLVTWEANLFKRNFSMQDLGRLAKSMVDHLAL